jgi:hypothetical protein
MQRIMAIRLKWLLILAFAVAQFSISGAASAAAGPVAVMENCNGTAGHCCDFGSAKHCSACVACVGYIAPVPYPASISISQSYRTAASPIFSSSVLAVEPPPPR